MCVEHAYSTFSIDIESKSEIECTEFDTYLNSSKIRYDTSEMLSGCLGKITNI